LPRKKTLVDIKSLARVHTATAIKTLQSIMMQTKSPTASRVAAAIALCDRGWGRPPQSVTGKDGEEDIRITIREIVETARGREKEGDEEN
jgi:hypothetical protein